MTILWKERETGDFSVSGLTRTPACNPHNQRPREATLLLLWLRSIFLLFRSSLVTILWPCCVLKWFCQTDFPFMASWFFSDGILTEGRRQDGVCGQQARHQRCPPQHVCCQQRRWREEHFAFFQTLVILAIADGGEVELRAAWNHRSGAGSSPERKTTR